MARARRISLAVRAMRYALLLAGAGALSLCAAHLGTAWAQAPYDNPATAEGWAWSKIKEGKPADFNEPCGTARAPLDPKDEKAARWQADCRKIAAGFLEDLLTRSPWREAVPRAGVRIAGARIVGDIDLENARLARPIEIYASRIEGGINLRRARTDSLVLIAGSVMNGVFDAGSLHSESGLFLRNGSVFNNAVRLVGAKVTGQVTMVGATVAGELNADALQVGDMLLMRSTDKNQASFQKIVLRGAKVTGQVDMDGATVAGELNADALQVGGSLLMRSTDKNQASFQKIVLRGAKVTGQVDMDGATVAGELNADALQVGDSLFMRSTLEHTAVFERVNLTFARIGANLDLRGAKIGAFDLAGASITGDFRLGGKGQSVVWTDKNSKPGTLNLRNTRISNLTDAETAWPAPGHLHLDGFAFSRLGGFAGETGREMRDRGMAWWDENWARLDHDYSPTPYAQLAAALTAAGDRDAANDIRFRGRLREQETEHGMAYLRSLILRWVAGFGIGDYTFRVVYWVFGISVLGACYLRLRVRGVRDAHHGFVWCWGASLARLLPVVEINREFTDFFNDPLRDRLTAFQSLVFSAIGVIGWGLGLILLAAVSGLTQHT